MGMHIYGQNKQYFIPRYICEGAKCFRYFLYYRKVVINSLQLIIVPMIFTSISLAMCKISDTKKLDVFHLKLYQDF